MELSLEDFVDDYKMKERKAKPLLKIIKNRIKNEDEMIKQDN
jgi:hypothetical protein